MLAVLGTALGLHEALLLLVAPAFLTNIWQAASGGFLPDLLKRLWPMLLTTIPGVFLGTRVLLRAEQGLLDVLLGIALCAYAVLSLSGACFSVPAGRERILGSVTGVMTGLVVGATGTLVLPVVPYLNALGLQRDELVQALGLSFALSSLALGVILTAEGAATPKGVAASLLRSCRRWRAWSSDSGCGRGLHRRGFGGGCSSACSSSEQTLSGAGSRRCYNPSPWSGSSVAHAGRPLHISATASASGSTTTLARCPAMTMDATLSGSLPNRSASR